MRAVAPLNIELSATPDRTMAEGVASLSFESARITRVVIIPPQKAAAETRYMLPAPETAITTAAPKDAPWETPSVEAEARGFRRTFCITAPHMASEAPTEAAVARRGSLIFLTIALSCLEEVPAMAFAASRMEISAEPAIKEANDKTMVMTAIAKRTLLLCPVYS